MNTLLIDTSNRPLSVAINRNGRTLVEINTTVKKTHSATLMVHVERLFEMAGMERHDIDRIIVARGPGSYTGVRIGVTTAKTLAYALGVELYSVSSLAVIAASSGRTGILAPMFDGRRGNVYSAIYKVESDDIVEEFTPGYMSLEVLIDKLEEYGRGTILLDVEEKFSNTVDSFIHAIPRISMVEAYEGILRKEDVHEMVPEYLKISEAEKNWLEKKQS